MTRRPVLIVSETAQATMYTAATREHPCETGGILLGVYVNGQPWVTSAVEISSADRGRRHYKLPGGTTQAAVRNARKSDRRLGYLGDWHSHPCDVGPSPTDLMSLTLISVKHPQTPNPTLVVVRATADGHSLDAHRVVIVAPRRCEVTLAGDLPPPTPSPQVRPR